MEGVIYVKGVNMTPLLSLMIPLSAILFDGNVHFARAFLHVHLAYAP